MEHQEKLPLQLRIGGVYRSRNGARFGPMEAFLFKGQTRFQEKGRYAVWWDGEGRSWGDEFSNHPFDLISEIAVLSLSTTIDEEPNAVEVQKLARELLPVIIQRHGFEPVVAADMAFQYAKAFFARADEE